MIGRKLFTACLMHMLVHIMHPAGFDCTSLPTICMVKGSDDSSVCACAGLSPPVIYFTDRSKAVLLLWIFHVFVLSCVYYVLCASVYMCFVVTCWERADLLALVCGVFCEFVTFPLVSWVRCGT